MFDHFSNRNKQAMAAARRAAQDLGHDYIGTEHILLGLCADSGNTACAVLTDLAVDPENVRAEVEKLVKRGKAKATGQWPFTPGGKRALELTMEAASELAHSYLGTEHVLLGLIQERRGIAARALAQLGVDFVSAREAVRRRCPQRPGPIDALGSPAAAEPGKTRSVMAALLGASDEALARGHAEVDVPHVLLALLELDRGFLAQWLNKLGVDVQSARQRLRDVLEEPGEV